MPIFTVTDAVFVTLVPHAYSSTLVGTVDPSLTMLLTVLLSPDSGGWMRMVSGFSTVTVKTAGADTFPAESLAVHEMVMAP